MSVNLASVWGGPMGRHGTSKSAVLLSVNLALVFGPAERHLNISQLLSI